MQQSVTLNGSGPRRGMSFVVGLGMVVFSFMTIDHFFAANYPASIWAGSFCDIGAFFNCDSSAYSVISQIAGVPLGYFGLMLGALFCLGAVFPSRGFERTNKTLSLANIIGVVVLLGYSIFILESVCLLCSGYYLFSALAFILFYRCRIDGDGPGALAYFLRPSLRLLVTFGIIALFGAWGMRQYHDARKEAQTGGISARIVAQYFELPTVELPSTLSENWPVRSTESFGDAPIRVVEFGDLICPDCLLFYKQLKRLQVEFEGQLNVSFQHFPLEAACNDVVDKDLHPGSCGLSFMAAHDPDKFNAIYTEIFENFQDAKHNPEWRQQLAERFGVEAALTDSVTIERVKDLIRTGTEYAKTSEEYAHGIRSTPTVIINNRMIIGTFPDAQLRAIFQALVDEQESDSTGSFLENWE